MNIREKMELLTDQLENADVSDEMKLSALYRASIKLANNLHRAYLTELEITETAKTVTSGLFALTSLAHPVIRSAQGICGVRISGGGLWMTPYDHKDSKKTENLYLAGTLNNPRFCVFGGNIQVSPSTITSIDVCYLRVPGPLLAQYTATGGSQTTILTTDTQLATDGNTLPQAADTFNGALIYNLTDGVYFKIKDYAYSSPTYTFTVDDPGSGTAGANGEKFYILGNGFDTLNLGNVTGELNEALHDIEITLAEAFCWGTKHLTRRNAALEAAFNEINALNARYGYEAPEGIGADKKGR